MKTEATLSKGLAIETCPACNSAEYDATGSLAPGFDCVLSERAFRQPDYAIRECSHCGLLYRTACLSANKLAEYYGLADYRKWEIPGHFPTERAALAVLRALPRGARILDFGCSSGRLLAPLVNDYDCHGFEINTEAAAAAAAKGLKMLPAYALEQGDGEKFDTVVAVDVFEHLSAPLELLRKLFRRVRRGGALLIVTGNGDAPACRLDPAQFWYFRNIEHLCMLTRRHARFLEHELTASLETWNELPHYDTPMAQRLRQHAQHFAYWQFRRGTLLAQTGLPLVPMLNRARRWPVAPAFTCCRDHVLAIFRKTSDA